MKSLGKISTGLLVVMIALAVVVILSTCLSCRNVVAYSADPNYTKVDKEGFSDLQPANFNTRERGLILEKIYKCLRF